MTAETLQAKLAEIRKQQEQTIANLNALQGAEQILLQLLNEEKDVTENENDNS